MQLDVFLPLPLTGRGPGYTCYQLACGMAGAELAVSIVTPRARGHARGPVELVQTLQPWARRLPYAWVRSHAHRSLEPAFLTHLKRGSTGRSAAYIWPDASLGMIEDLRRAGTMVFREMINGPRGAAKAILDEAYARVGADPCHAISEASVAAEDSALEAVDYIFCPNALVEDALRRRGVPASKLIGASYGWDPQRFGGRTRMLPQAPGLTVLFVGGISVRKGAHLLLESWVRSRVRGRLVLAGALEPAIKQRYASLLAREDVTVLPYVQDVGSLYRSADVFAFPTLEEGGPQVTYEACGCGLPVITTPMGAGRIVTHDREGFVLDPYDSKGWVAALQAMQADAGRRRAMAEAASAAALSYHWDRVAQRRRRDLINRLSAGPGLATRPQRAGRLVPEQQQWPGLAGQVAAGGAAPFGTEWRA